MILYPDLKSIQNFHLFFLLYRLYEKKYLIIVGLLISTITQAQIGDVFSSIIKDETGVDLTKTKTVTSTPTNTTSASNANINLGNLTQTEI